MSILQFSIRISRSKARIVEDSCVDWSRDDVEETSGRICAQVGRSWRDEIVPYESVVWIEERGHHDVCKL